MADHIHHTSDNTSSATILVSVVIVLIVALAFYFGVIRGNIGSGPATNGVNVELNAPAAEDGTAEAGAGVESLNE